MPTAEGAPVAAVALEPDGLRFVAPVTITIPLDGSKVDATWMAAIGGKLGTCVTSGLKDGKPSFALPATPQ